MVVNIAVIIDTNITLAVDERVDVKAGSGRFARELSKQVNELFLQRNCEVFLLSKKHNSSFGY